MEILTSYTACRQYDGLVDAFGMGGIDLYLSAGRTIYYKGCIANKEAAKKTPMVEGSDSRHLWKEFLSLSMICGESGRQEGFYDASSRPVWHGRAFRKRAANWFWKSMVALGINIPIRSLRLLTELPVLLHL